MRFGSPENRRWLLIGAAVGSVLFVLLLFGSGDHGEVRMHRTQRKSDRNSVREQSDALQPSFSVEKSSFRSYAGARLLHIDTEPLQSATGNIEQVFVCPFFSKHWQEVWLRKLSGTIQLRSYNDPNAPSFFIGLAHPSCLSVFQSHKSFAIVILAGRDGNDSIAQTRVLLKYLRFNARRVRVVATNEFMKVVVRRNAVPYVSIPMFAWDMDQFKPVKRGPAVCLYGLPHEVYHNDVVRRFVEPRFPNLKFIYTANLGSDFLNANLPAPFKYYSATEMIRSVLPQCFIVIRLTLHDGLAGVVQEAGMMGIRSVWNGGTPSALPWRYVDDIVNAVEWEAKYIGSADAALSASVKQFLQLKPEVFQLSYYFDKKNIEFDPRVPDPEDEILVVGTPTHRLGAMLAASYLCDLEEETLKSDSRFSVIDGLNEENLPALRLAIENHRGPILISSLLVALMASDRGVLSNDLFRVKNLRKVIIELALALSNRKGGGLLGFWLADAHSYTFGYDLSNLRRWMQKVGASLVLSRYLLTRDMDVLSYALDPIEYPVRIKHLPLHVEAGPPTFKPMASRKYDILMYGNAYPATYPFRARLISMLKKAGTVIRVVWCETNTRQARLHVVGETPGIDSFIVLGGCQGESLRQLMADTRLAVVTPGAADYWVRKYFEMPMQGVVMVGRVPVDAVGYFDSSNMIEVDTYMTDLEISSLVLSSLRNYTKLDNMAKAARESVGMFAFDRYADHLAEAVQDTSTNALPGYMRLRFYKEKMKFHFDMLGLLERLSILALPKTERKPLRKAQD